MDLTRATPAALLAEISGSHFYPCVLIWLDWPGAPLRAHTGVGEIVWQGETWQGVGRFGSVDVPEELMTAVPSEFSISLVTDYPEIEDYTDTVIRGIDGQVYLGATTTRGGNDLIGAVEIVSGAADGLAMAVTFEDRPGATVTLYRITANMNSGPGMRTDAAIAHSSEDQRRVYPNDTAGRHLILAGANAKKTLWPEP